MKSPTDCNKTHQKNTNIKIASPKNVSKKEQKIHQPASLALTCSKVTFKLLLVALPKPPRGPRNDLSKIPAVPKRGVPPGTSHIPLGGASHG